MDFQFYPTPISLARHAWSKFKDRDIVRVLEPSAGNGDLIKGHKSFEEEYCRYRSSSSIGSQVDCIELDPSKHAELQALGATIIGHDFMDLSDASIYSHIIMNPPFADGCKHVLKAWDLLYDGEIVAIVNAETIRNPFSREREFLLQIIEQHGEVEFLQEAFTTIEAERKTEVEIAIIHLTKSNVDHVINMSALLSGLTEDGKNNKEHFEKSFTPEANIAFPRSLIENSVLVFEMAVGAMKESLIHEAKASYYSGLMSRTLAELNSKDMASGSVKVIKCHRTEMMTRYNDLKAKAWTGIIRSGDFTSRLSSKAQRDVEKEFEKIRKLDFTIKNIYGFLLGIVESQGEIQSQMACDVFDLITRYHEDNTCFYMGWKSNTKHNTCGRKIKTTRFVIPGHKQESWSKSMGYTSNQMLRDFDKVFAMMDGVSKPEISLEYIFDRRLSDLKEGQRVESSYFDVRYYPGVGTIHFFPKSKTLIDRFNRFVGRQRQWLPPEMSQASNGFEAQYEAAEKANTDVRAALKKSHGGGYRSPFFNMNSGDEQEKEANHSVVYAAIEQVMLERGIDCENQIGFAGSSSRTPATQLMLA